MAYSPCAYIYMFEHVQAHEHLWVSGKMKMIWSECAWCQYNDVRQKISIVCSRLAYILDSSSKHLNMCEPRLWLRSTALRIVWEIYVIASHWMSEMSGKKVIAVWHRIEFHWTKFWRRHSMQRTGFLWFFLIKTKIEIYMTRRSMPTKWVPFLPISANLILIYISGRTGTIEKIINCTPTIIIFTVKT